MSPRICAGVRKDGTPCRTVATADGYCFAHSAACQERTARARAQGGKNSSRAVRARKRMGADLHDIAKLLEDAMRDVAKGAMLPQQGSALASLAGAWLRLHEAGEVQARIEELEARLEAQPAQAWRR